MVNALGPLSDPDGLPARFDPTGPGALRGEHAAGLASSRRLGLAFTLRSRPLGQGAKLFPLS